MEQRLFWAPRVDQLVKKLAAFVKSEGLLFESQEIVICFESHETSHNLKYCSFHLR
jgi:hypothetical protein